ncbi:transglycosylase SLT domain-containing protein [Thiohalocapsa marina]|nr:transglycosylase SLT domain-containing protein [Thiohalocapsa marina]
MRPAKAPRYAAPGPMRVVFTDGQGARRAQTFTAPVVIGRGQDCGLRIAHAMVSRHHLALSPEDGTWWIRDLQSSNGTLVGGRVIDRMPVTGETTVQLGADGPVLHLSPPAAPRETRRTVSLEDISKHYFDRQSPDAAGEHTRMIRRAYREQRLKQRRVYAFMLSGVLLLLLMVGGFALFQYWQLEKTRELAKETFYEMKELELHIANLEASIEQDASAAVRARIAESKRLLAGLRERYDAFVQEVQASRIIKFSSEDQIILHMARTFGETELDLPDDFVAEVKRYIRKWQATPRLEHAIRRLHENGYAPIIYRELVAQELPPQFLYLALQESGFRQDAVGPPTRYGHAKGMWQFIPDTARRYGLTPGPLQHLGRYDPEDDRHNVAKATKAAARYLKDIYRTDAQASGLLVMASYNWGEGNIIKRLRKMPENPRERNFWKLLREHKIPKETYDYVFYIFSAAVIGENPRLFGFDFDNPVQGLRQIPAIR